MNEINKQKIIKLAEKHGLTARWMDTGILLLENRLDEWRCKELTNGQILLEHKNKNSRGYKYHEQRTFSDYNQLIDSIYKHDKYKIGERRKNRITEIFDRLKKNDLPKWIIS